MEIENRKKEKHQRKSIKLKAGSLKSSRKLTDLQQTDKEKRKTQIVSIRNETGGIIIASTDIKMIIMEYYE